MNLWNSKNIITKRFIYTLKTSARLSTLHTLQVCYIAILAGLYVVNHLPASCADVINSLIAVSYSVPMITHSLSPQLQRSVPLSITFRCCANMSKNVTLSVQVLHYISLASASHSANDGFLYSKNNAS